MRILICDDEQKLIDLELSILQEYCRSTNIAATFFYIHRFPKCWKYR